MSFLNQALFKFWDPDGTTSKLVRAWTPKGCETEKDYERSLYNHLHDNLSDVQVTKQYARGRIRADLVVGEKVIIEIKNNLQSTGAYQRLVGQLTSYADWDGFVLVVLCGKTDKNLLKDLKRFVEQFRSGLLIGGERMQVIQK